MANYHVVESDNKEWAVERAGSKRASSIHSTQRGALEAAKTYTINSGGGEVSVHGANGKVRNKNTYGKVDHHPPKG